MILLVSSSEEAPDLQLQKNKYSSKPEEIVQKEDGVKLQQLQKKKLRDVINTLEDPLHSSSLKKEETIQKLLRSIKKQQQMKKKNLRGATKISDDPQLSSTAPLHTVLKGMINNRKMLFKKIINNGEAIIKELYEEGKHVAARMKEIFAKLKDQDSDEAVPDLNNRRDIPPEVDYMFPHSITINTRWANVTFSQ